MDEQIERSRAFYTQMRKVTGCPPIVMSDFGDGTYYVETKDGEVHLEQIKACNSWDAKAQCIDEWVKRHPKKT